MPLKTRHKIMIARMVQFPIIFVLRIFGFSTSPKVKRKGLFWNLDLSEGIDFSIYIFGQFEVRSFRAMSSLVKKGDIVFDIGANIGAHTLPLANIVGDSGRIHAFEPTSYAHTKLMQNIQSNPHLFNRIEVNQVMLTSDSSDKLQEQLYSSWPLDSNNQQHDKHCGRLHSTQGATVLTLDDYVYEKGITKVSLIKLDVDGYELDVLRGARNVLSDHRPTLLMELSPYTHIERGQDIEDLLQLLAVANYTIRTQTTRRKLPLSSTELAKIIPDGGSLNVIATPS